MPSLRGRIGVLARRLAILAHVGHDVQLFVVVGGGARHDVLAERSPTAAERDQLLLGQVLVAVDEHLVPVQRVGEPLQVGIAQRPRQIGAKHFGAHHRVERTNDEFAGGRGDTLGNVTTLGRHHYLLRGTIAR
jgi:hypothetical protein